MTTSRSILPRFVAVALLSAVLPSCAARVAVPPAVTTPQFPEFVFPAAVDADRATETRQQDAWQWLQAGNLRTADREFGAILRQRPGYAPAEAGLGYVELARREPDEAVARFDRALQALPSYAPALVGRAQALVALGRDSEALAAYEAAAKADPSLDLGTRIAVLRFRGAGDAVGEARKAASEGRLEAAQQAYLRAIAGSPESGFLYRELGAIEMKLGRLDEALEHLRRAATLEPTDPRSWALIGTIEAERGNPEAALEAYEAAQRIEPAADVQQKIEDLRQRVEYDRLPASYRAIAAAPVVTRGDVAATLGVRLGTLIGTVQPREGVLLTDIRGHWATQWILAVVRAGVMEAFPNHTFQPAQRVRRADFAQIALRVLNLAAAQGQAAPAGWRTARVAVADIPATHPAYPAVSATIAAGILQADENGHFEPNRAMTGAELIEAASRLESLAGAGAGARRR